MGKKYILVEMPGDWKGNIDNCPLLEHGCGEFGQCKDGCPLANAKQAVEATTDDMETYDDMATGEQTINGKLVKLWATQEAK